MKYSAFAILLISLTLSSQKPPKKISSDAVENYYLPDIKYNTVVYDILPNVDEDGKAKRVDLYIKRDNSYEIASKTYYEGRLVSILKSTVVFENNEVRLTETVTNNIVETNQRKKYNPSITLFKIPQRGSTVKWIYNTTNKDKYKNICTAYWGTELVVENGKKRSLNLIKVEKVIPDLKDVKTVEYYREGYGLVKVEFVSKGGKSTLHASASEWSKEKVD